MKHNGARISAIAAAGALLCHFPLTAADSQALRGRVTIGSSTLAAQGAGVILLGADGEPKNATLTDSAGRYIIVAPAPGQFRLRVHNITASVIVETSPFHLKLADTLTLDLALVATAYKLGTMEIRARTLEHVPGNPTKFDEFLRRKKMGLGHFLMRDDIEKKGMNTVRDLLRTVPGMLISESGAHLTVQSKRCSGRSIPGLDASSLAGGSSGPDPKQQPMLFVDGIRVREIATINEIHPRQIEAIEIYQGAAQLPVEARGDSCAAILIWLRSYR